MKLFRSKKVSTVLTAVFAVLLVVCLIAIPITNGFATSINIALNAKTQKVIPDPDATIYFWSNYDSEDDLVAFEKQLCHDIEAEGASLLINRDDTLPLANGTKFTPFSQSSYNLLYGGTGSGQVSAEDAVTLKDAIDGVFGNDALNPNQWDFYADSGYTRVNADTTGGNQGQYRINEVPWDKYSDSLKNTWSSYGDVALVVLARSGGEGADLPSAHPELTQYMTDGDYLRLCKEELDMFENLEKLKEQGVFKKIVVLLNSSNSLQMDFVDDYGIDAVLWIGDVGMTGITAVADILAGNVNPSGRIVDTFLKDNHSSPAMQNFGAYPWTNGATYDVATAQNNTDPGINKCNQNYVVYQEGIYVGYRYYETRYEDLVLNRGNAGEYNYTADVAFPFGYGLSYTTFAYSNFSVSDQGDHFEVEVDVTNTGAVDGKHTVQIYFQSPYTQYDIDNQVEKAAVELCGFDKRFIAAGDTEHFTINVNKEDLTSYDANSAKTYILEDGDYYFTVGTDAHNAINNILMAKGADTARMAGTGDAALVQKWNNPTFDKTTYAVSSVTGNPITNLFENADLNKYSGNDGQTVTYLTRNNWTETFPVTQSLYITEQMWKDGLSHDDADRQAMVETAKSLYWSDATAMPPVGAQNGLSASMFAEKDADDADWEKLVQQIPYDELTNLIYNGFHNTVPVPSISLPGTLDENGPQGFTMGLTGGASAMAYTSEDVMAATFNRELIESMGKCIGEDFLHAANAGDTVYAGIYGPGANIHRTPYCGRNFEYYSEDGWLAGEVAAVEVAAIQDRGVYVFTKHFALNDQEEGRYGIATWSNEQAIRELYLEGFEGSVAKGGGMGVMSSFNRLGVTWSGAHRGLMTGILRDEWGMKGAAITDCSIMAAFMDYRMGVLAGQDIWDGMSMRMATLDGLDNDPAIVSACQEAAKHILYSVTHSHAMNVGNATVVPITPWWQTALYALAGIMAALTAGSTVLLILNTRKSKVKTDDEGNS